MNNEFLNALSDINQTTVQAVGLMSNQSSYIELCKMQVDNFVRMYSNNVTIECAGNNNQETRGGLTDRRTPLPPVPPTKGGK
jgi:hypothetical protein